MRSGIRFRAHPLLCVSALLWIITILTPGPTALADQGVSPAEPEREAHIAVPADGGNVVDGDHNSPSYEYLEGHSSPEHLTALRPIAMVVVPLLALLLFLFLWFWSLRKQVASRTEALREREEFQQALFACSPVALYSVDLNGNVIAWNASAKRIFGWSADEVLGRPLPIVPEDKQEEFAANRRQIVEHGGVKDMHLIRQRKDGSLFDASLSAALIHDAEGRVFGIMASLEDITERKRTEEHLRESENRYRLLADNTLDVIWTMNLDLEFTYVNPAIRMMTGHSPEEWIGSRLPDHCDEANFAKMAKIISEEIQKGPGSAGVIFEVDMHTKNRGPIPVEIRGKLFFDDTGQPVRLQGTSRDISERRRAEDALRYQDRLLRQMGAIAGIGGWEFDPSTGEGTWTEEVARIHDLDPNEKTNAQKGLSFYRGESRERIENALKEAVELGKPFDLELELVSAKGVRKWVRSIGRPRIEDGKVTQVRGSFQEITERKRSELQIAHLNRVLRAVRGVNQLIVREHDRDALIREGCGLLVDNRGYPSALIVLTDHEDRPVSWAAAGSAAGSDILAEAFERGELPPCSEHARRKKSVQLVRDRDSACGPCPLRANCAEGQSLCVPMIYEGKTFGYLAATAEERLEVDDEERSLFSEMAGDFAYALNAMNVEAERRQGEDEREKLQAQLIQAQKMESVGRLAGGVAHDYNNMLSVIIGYAELAIDKVSTDNPLHKDLKEIYDAARRSGEITRQLLAFARRQTIQPKVLDLNKTVEGMLKMLHRLIGEDIDLSWRPGPGLWPLKVDPSQIDQVLANLCVNARDAIRGVGKITIETDNVSFDEDDCADHAGFVPGDFVLLAVSDNGCGMDPETLEFIFEPFFTTKDIGEGTGLGLATVYGIVKQNDGFINVYSEPQQGTTFRVYLPRHDGETDPIEAREAGEIPSGRGETVLIVEDDPSILRLVKAILERLDYTVLDASTPSRAISLAEAHEGAIHVLITDVVMPEMNGRDLADHLLTYYPNLKILFMSGYTANVIAHRGVLEEGVHFIQKPFSKRDLAAKVHEVLLS